jgi:hypothetical protein
VRPRKLPDTACAEIMQTVEKRRAIMKEIARLEDEKRQIPNNKTLAKRLGVCYSVVRRALYGDPYKTPHPADESVRAA